MKIDQWVPVQRSSATCWIGNPSVALVLTTMPGITNGLFASFSERAAAITPMRVGFFPAFRSASTSVNADAMPAT